MSDEQIMTTVDPESDNAERAEIDWITERVVNQRAGQDRLCILGGRIPADAVALSRLLGTFSGMPLHTSLRHWTYKIAFGPGIDDTELIPDVHLLERLRLFGHQPATTSAGHTDDHPWPAAGGDLELHRNGETLHWRFIGRPNTDLAAAVQQAGLDAPADYWRAHPGQPLFWRRTHMLLWGSRPPDQHPHPDRFRDDRVGWARLDYPIPADAERARINLIEFAHQGALAFTWWLEVQKHA